MLLCSRKCIFCSCETLLGEIAVVVFPQSCCLSSAGCQIKSCCCRRRLDDTLHIVVGRRDAEGSPLLVVSLVVSHALVFAAFDYHFQHPFHFPAGFVEKVGSAVCAFGKKHCSVAVSVLKAVFESCFILVLHEPEGEAAVYNILTVVACVIPAACNVYRAAAAAVAPCLLYLSHILGVTCCTGKLGSLA